MSKTARGVDFLSLDGGEGGSGAAPLAFSDHVALPFKVGFSRVYQILAEAGIHEDVVLIGSGKLGFPADAMVAFALGCDAINVGREAMMAIGCIQAQRCHTGHCPTGVATQNRWLVRGLDPTSKAARLASSRRATPNFPSVVVIERLSSSSNATRAFSRFRCSRTMEGRRRPSSNTVAADDFNTNSHTAWRLG